MASLNKQQKRAKRAKAKAKQIRMVGRKPLDQDEDLGHLARTAEELLRHNVAGIDLNLGCPAPKVYKKNVGGGLLREPAKVGEILALLRSIVPGLFTVKMRIGINSVVGT